MNVIKKISRKDGFVEHQKSEHEGIKFKCNKCNFETKRKSYLLSHQQKQHNTGMMIPCNTCSFQAKTKQNLYMRTTQDFIKEANIFVVYVTLSFL